MNRQRFPSGAGIALLLLRMESLWRDSNLLTLKAALMEERELILKGIIEKLTSYAQGREVTRADREHVDAVLESIDEENDSLRAAIHAIGATPHSV